MFDPLLVQMKTLYSQPDENSEFVGALLRPMAEGMKEMIKAGETKLIDEVFQAAKEAGHRLVKEDRISDKILLKVSRLLAPKDAYDKAFQEAINQAKKSAGR